MWTVTANEAQGIILIKSDTRFDFPSLQKILSRIYLENDGKYASFKRFADLSAIDQFDVNLETFAENLHLYRQISPLGSDVKMAVYFPASTPSTTKSLARLFMDVAENDALRIRVFHSLDACADYLSVDRKSLRI